jgi:hypothetical protein
MPIRAQETIGLFAVQCQIGKGGHNGCSSTWWSSGSEGAHHICLSFVPESMLQHTTFQNATLTISSTIPSISFSLCNRHHTSARSPFRRVKAYNSFFSFSASFASGTALLIKLSPT